MARDHATEQGKGSLTHDTFELLEQQVDNLRRKHQVAALEQQQAALAMVKPDEQQRMFEQFQFFLGEDQPISTLHQLAPLPLQFQPFLQSGAWNFAGLIWPRRDDVGQDMIEPLPDFEPLLAIYHEGFLCRLQQRHFLNLRGSEISTE
ncbi:unnamed protein product [Dovyalis caffra]|uniref:Uncharacterized protein n=1 Tax=Dovyalis caffra TaxID=77055 RepID=A0AAV1RKQ6_9ROSI|nr:unnamed protein product [Dovyalis caffra]